jgi:four helix bundle protein
MGKIQQFEDLDIWKQATQIAVDVFGITLNEPLKSDFGTKDQLRRAALSISSNIAEGFEYNNDADFVRFLKYAKGSTGELRSQLFILCQLGTVSSAFYEQKHQELSKLSRQIGSLLNRIAEKKAQNRAPVTRNL